MKIEFNRYSSEALNEIVNAIMIEDWQSVKDEVKSLKKRLSSDTIIEGYEKVLKEDLKFNKKVKKAYETILRYSLPWDRAVEILGEEKCKTDGQ